MSCGRPRAALGGWLRQQRRERGWNVPEMTRQLRQAATTAGDKLPSNECLFTMIRRWERGETGVSERYMLHYCRAFGIGADQFGPPGGGDAERADDADLRGPGPAAAGWLAGLLKDVRDGLREDAKARQTRAGQVAAGAACAAALCRGQALAFAAAAEYIDAVLAEEWTREPSPVCDHVRGTARP